MNNLALGLIIPQLIDRRNDIVPVGEARALSSAGDIYKRTLSFIIACTRSFRIIIAHTDENVNYFLCISEYYDFNVTKPLPLKLNNFLVFNNFFEKRGQRS